MKKDTGKKKPTGQTMANKNPPKKTKGNKGGAKKAFTDPPTQPKPKQAEIRIRRNISRVLRVKMCKGDLERSHHAQEGIVGELDKEQAKLENLAEELKAVELRRKKLLAEIRDCEINREALHTQMTEHVRARQSGMMLANVVVDEWVSNRGEIIHRKIGTMVEVGERRNATGEELEMANQLRIKGTPDNVLTEDHKGESGKAVDAESAPLFAEVKPKLTDDKRTKKRDKRTAGQAPVPAPALGGEGIGPTGQDGKEPSSGGAAVHRLFAGEPAHDNDLP